MKSQPLTESELLLNESVLVLNKHYLPVQVTTAKEAICVLVTGKALVVTQDYVTHDLKAWAAFSVNLTPPCVVDLYPGVLRSPSIQLLIPQVILICDCDFNAPLLKAVRYSRGNILQRDNYTCQYCGHKLSKNNLTLDHVMPRSRGGKNLWNNIVTACKTCNGKKGDKLLSELNWKLLNKPITPEWRSHIGVPFNQTKKKYWNNFLK